MQAKASASVMPKRSHIQAILVGDPELWIQNKF